jgi:hypothetical protein
MLSTYKRMMVDVVAPLCTGKVKKVGQAVRSSHNDLGALLMEHFGGSNPQCRTTLTRSLHELHLKSANIVETGSSAWGVNSSLLFDSYVNSFGGHFDTVDKRLVPLLTLHGKVTAKTSMYCDDSVKFLNKIIATRDKLDLVYLDSWDVDWYSPLPSSYHGLNEMMAILPLLVKSHGMLLVDDTPADPTIFSKETGIEQSVFETFYNNYGIFPGKGGLILNYLRGANIGTVIQHDYQVLIKF